jgi:O-acetyl-ADP-ribose deacetylase (regulator of RNase III)
MPNVRRVWVTAGIVLGTVANLLQVVSWLWGGSRNWVNSHGLLISGVSILTILAVISSFYFLRTPRMRSAADPPPEEAPLSIVHHGPFNIRITDNMTVSFYSHYGAIEVLEDIDILVSSENTYLQMSQMFKPSTSGRLRYAVALKDDLGRVLQDITQDELFQWMRDRNGYGAKVAAGTVVPTSAGSLESRGVRRIYHAAVVQPEDGSGTYHVNRQTVTKVVANSFRAIAAENQTLATPLRSICFPLLGAGRGGLDNKISLEALYSAIVDELKGSEDLSAPWTIHIICWRKRDSDMVIEFFKSKL